MECRKESRSSSLTRSSDTAEVEMEPVAVKIKTVALRDDKGSSRQNCLTRSSDTAEVEMEPVAVKIKTQPRRPQPSFGTLNTMEEIPPVLV